MTPVAPQTAPRLMVLGSLNLDLVLHLDHAPLRGETVTATGYDESLGGKGANQAVACARLGASVAMIGCVGHDPAGDRLLEGLRSAGVDATAIARVPQPSGFAVILHEPDGSNSIVVHPGANAELSAERVEAHADMLRSASVVLLQLESPLTAVERAAALAAHAGAAVILDPAPAIELPRSLLEHVTWLTPNQTETQTLLGGRCSHPGEPEIAATLLALGPHNVALKLGERGVFLAGRDCDPILVPGFRVQPADTTAAGDCFNAAFAHRLALGDAPPLAARYANAAAALSVTRPGAQAAMPHASEVDAFLASHAQP